MISLELIDHLGQSEDIYDKYVLVTQILGDKNNLAELVYQKLKLHMGFKITDVKTFPIVIQEKFTIDGDTFIKLKSLIIESIKEQPIIVLLAELGLTDLYERLINEVDNTPLDYLDKLNYIHFDIDVFVHIIEFAKERSPKLYKLMITGFMENVNMILTQKNKDVLQEYIQPIDPTKSYKHLYPLFSQMYGGHYVINTFFDEQSISKFFDESNSVRANTEDEVVKENVDEPINEVAIDEPINADDAGCFVCRLKK